LPTPIHIGTSGWNYPGGRGTWNGVFYPARRSRGFDELAWYAEHFDTVEVNSTFYRMPEPDLSAGWIKRTPSDFLFSVKLYQKFTHPDMYLAREGVTGWDLSRTDVDLFRRGIEPFADAGKLAAVLAQFPPSFKAAPETADYLEWLLSGLALPYVAVELRHQSWLDPARQTRARLAQHGASLVTFDAPKGVGGGSVENTSDPVTSDPVYLRLHGRNAETWWKHEKSEDRYNYHYSADELRPFAAAAGKAAASGRKVLIYLNNHFSAKSVANAAVLRHQVGLDVPGDYPPEMLRRFPDLAGIVTPTGLPL